FSQHFPFEPELGKGGLFGKLQQGAGQMKGLFRVGENARYPEGAPGIMKVRYVKKSRLYTSDSEKVKCPLAR
ncbi:MAG: hypothetical protein ACJA1F_000815, partial [Paracoccaceae bacterium]